MDNGTDVNALANCTSVLVQMVCNDDGCSTFDPTQTDIISQCSIAQEGIASFDAANAAYDPCGVLQPPDWTLGLHIAAVFVVLIASTTGAGVPLLAKYHPGFDLNPIWIIIGKCMGIGVVLACGLVHMLQPSNVSLTSPCLPWEFNTDYTYAYLYAVLAILAMHFLDWSVEAYLLDKWLNVPASQQPHTHHDEIAMVKIGDINVGAAKIPADEPNPIVLKERREQKEVDDMERQAGGHGDKEEPVSQQPPMSPSASTEPPTPSSNHAEYNALKSPTAIGSSMLDLRVGKKLAGLSDLHAGDHGHVHSILLVAGLKRTISAYMLEFGVTVHSVFIGLANGIDGDDQLHVLLVALVFHQMFEGIALGSRIADANFPSHWHEFILTVTFSLAAPIGIAIGIGVKTGLNPNGETFLMIQGTFDGVCGGILIYIGVLLLIKDFPEDMQRFCKGSPKKYWLMTGKNCTAHHVSPATRDRTPSHATTMIPPPRHPHLFPPPFLPLLRQQLDEVRHVRGALRRRGPHVLHRQVPVGFIGKYL